MSEGEGLWNAHFSTAGFICSEAQPVGRVDRQEKVKGKGCRCKNGSEGKQVGGMAHTMMRNVSCVNQLNSASSALPADSPSSRVVVCVVPHGIFTPSSFWKQRRHPSSGSIRSLKSGAVSFRTKKLASSVKRRLLPAEEVPGASCFSTTSVPDEGTTGVPGLSAFAQSGMVEMKREYGAFGGATLEKSKLELSSAQVKSSPQVFSCHLTIGARVAHLVKMKACGVEWLTFNSRDVFGVSLSAFVAHVHVAHAIGVGFLSSIASRRANRPQFSQLELFVGLKSSW